MADVCQGGKEVNTREHRFCIAIRVSDGGERAYFPSQRASEILPPSRDG